MNSLPPGRHPPPTRQRTAVVVLVISLAATLFAVWREHELAWRNQIIRFQDGISQTSPAMLSLLGVRFEELRDLARATVRRDQYSLAGWGEFTNDAHWHSRYPGMKEIGYADFTGSNCLVKFAEGAGSPPAHLPGDDLAGDATIRKAVQKSADAGVSLASGFISLGEGSHAVPVVIGLLRLSNRDILPGTAAENRANLHGFIFFALHQQEYFRSCEAQLEGNAFSLRLLEPGEPAPPRDTTQRVVSTTTVSGVWRFAASMAPPAASEKISQWVVLTVGTGLSFLLYSLLVTQARLREAGEHASEKIQEREDALAREKELNRLKSNFVSMVTHEIRTPLAHILGSSDILSRYHDRLAPEKRAQQFSFINSAVQRMSALIEDVLLFSKAEAGRMDFCPVTLDLKNFCSQITDELRLATNCRCPVELTLDGVSELARGDESLLRHVFMNLLTNAVKYSPAGKPVKFTASREGGYAVFLVQDGGLGIPEADLRQVFTPFHRGKNVAALNGTGLGLVIVKHCVERHGGHIEMESRENLGTTVCVRLPLFSPAHTEFIRRPAAEPPAL